MVVREHESRLASVEAKIRNNSVNSLHHQLKAERDVLRREQLDQLKTAKVSILLRTLMEHRRFDLKLNILSYFE